MPKRKAARAFRGPGVGSVAEMRAHYDTPMDLFFARYEMFTEFPMPRERWIFAQAFPEEFFAHFGFFSHPSDNWPASTEYAVREMFKRPKDAFLKLLRTRPPKTPFYPAFDPMHHPGNVIEKAATVARWRGEWWLANGWPMSPEERAWLEEQGHSEAPGGDGGQQVIPQHSPGAKVTQMPAKEN